MQTEDELYKELGALTKARDKWEESIPYVSSLLNHDSERIQAKALWLLGEMGFASPQAVQNAVPTIASFLNSPAPLLRERSVNAGCKSQAELYLGIRKHRDKYAGYL